MDAKSELSRWIADFYKVRALVRELGMPLFEEHVDRIYRLILTTPSSRDAHPLHHLSVRFRLAFYYARTRWQQLTLRAEPSREPVDVLIPFVPYRQDYAELLLPVADALVRRGLRVAVYYPMEAAHLPREAPLPGMTRVHASQVDAGLAFRQASAEVRSLRSAIERLCGVVAAGPAADRVLLYFMSNAWGAWTFGQVLARLRPRLIFGLHFMTAPGCMTALTRLPAARRPKVVFIQHGLFSHGYGFHDFGGGDQVIVWGESQGAVLGAVQTTPVPEAVVVGNPKAYFLRMRGRAYGAETRPPRVLYASTVAQVEGDTTYEEALSRFASAARGAGSWKPVYRPHPAEPRERFLAAAGLASADELDSPASLEACFQAVCAVVGVDSTVLLDAIAWGLPVARVNAPQAAISGEFWEALGIEAFDTPAALDEYLARVATDGGFAARLASTQFARLEAVFGKLDAVPERVAAHLAGLLDDASPRG